MKKPGATTAKHSSPPASEGVGVRAVTCSLVLFLGAALVATPIAYGDDAKTPGITPEETIAERQQDDSTSMPASPATYAGANEKSPRQPSRLLDSAIEEPPGQALDLGLCDGS